MSSNGLIQTAQQHSVQDLPNALRGERVFNFYAQHSRARLLPQWATRDSEIRLRQWDRHEYNWAWQGARSGIGKKFAGTPFEITGPENTPPQEIAYWQDVFRGANFGQGWGDFAKKGSRDYLRQDGGWYFELIAPGDPLLEPTGAVVGIAHLDSLRCYPTGDPDYPVIYWSRYNEMHILHRSRVAHVLDSPDGDESNPGYGECALRRAISITQRQILMGRYIEGRLDDKPAPGIVATNLPRDEREQAAALYKAEQSTDEKPFWGEQLWLFHSDPTTKPEIQTIAFSQAPEKFSYQEYMDIDINALALALGVDIQELWQLTGGQQGSQAQSEILNAKSRGKTFGDLLTSFERVANDILPEHLTFEFKYRDEQEEKEKAENAQLHGQAIQVVSGNMSQDEVRQYLANNVPSFADVLLDERGQLKPLAAPSNSDVVGNDSTPLDTANSEKPQDTPGLSQPPAQPLLPAMTRAFHGQKDFMSTRREFINSFVDLVNAGRNDDVTRRRFGTVLRAQLRRLGAIAYRDGLRAGGIQDELSDEDLLEVQSWSQEQSVYVTNFGAELFQKGLNPTQVFQRAEMWSNKSLETIYQKGLASADKNGLYTWVLGNTEKHCTTCLMMSGQTHRLKEYTKRGIVPKSSKLDCGGWLCDCSLKRGTGTSKGRFPREKAFKGSWDEGKHPRADDGKFGHGGGGGGGGDEGGDSDQPSPPAATVEPNWAGGKHRPPNLNGEYQDYGTMPFRGGDPEAGAAATKLSEQQTQGLDKRSTAALETYAGESYSDINGHLRTGEPASAKTKKTIAALDDTLNNASLPENTVVYRGMSMDKNAVKNLKPGATFKDKAFVSTSLSEERADVFSNFSYGKDAVMFRVKAPKGSKGMAIEAVSGFTLEREVLFARETEFAITKVTKKKGKYYVDAEIITGRNP